MFVSSSLASIQETITIAAEAAFSPSSSSDNVEYVTIGKEKAGCMLRRILSRKNLWLSITAMNPSPFRLASSLVLLVEPARL